MEGREGILESKWEGEERRGDGERGGERKGTRGREGQGGEETIRRERKS